MTFNSLLFLVSAAFSIGLAFFILSRDTRSLVHGIFSMGMAVLGIEAILNYFSVRTLSVVEVVRWQHLRFVAAAFLPGIWLIFSLALGRANYQEFIARWKWIILAAFIVPLGLVTVFGKAFFEGLPLPNQSHSGLLKLGWSGYVLHFVFLLTAILILMNLEKTLRASSGRMRWQIKFIVLGIGGLFAARIYGVSQSLLYKSLNTELEIVQAGALIVACALISRALFRTSLFHVDFYASPSFLYNSFTILFVGIYLLSLGILARAAAYLGVPQNLPMEAFFVFAALLGLTILLLSDRLRKRVKWFISRHFKRPIYDYRKEWTKFTERTTSVMEMKDLCSVVAKMISETLDLLSVTVWIVNEAPESVELGGSTVFSERQLQELYSVKRDVKELVRFIRQAKPPIDFDYSIGDWSKEENGFNGKFFLQTRIRYCFPLIAGGRFLGLMTVGDQVGGDDLSEESLDLLKTIADQTAGSLLNLKLSGDLRQAKEMEIFQTMAAFFVHDLKNLASNLSLTMQNIPIHFDNPDFRKDAVEVIAKSLNKIDGLCSRLSSLSRKLELDFRETDLNELVKNAVSSLDGCLKNSPILSLHRVPTVFVDAEQFQKVLVNLILNANEAISDAGEIRVTTGQQNGFVALSVRDNGCGMSQEFIHNHLFRLFKSTKKQGMGIGLYQSKKIVEAHGGRIEVESEEDRGTTFRIILPILKE